MLGLCCKGCQPPPGPSWAGPGTEGGPRVPSCPWGGSKAVTVALRGTCVPSWHLLGATPLLDVLSTEMAGPGLCRLGPGNCWGLAGRCHCCSARLICSGNHEAQAAWTSGLWRTGCLKREEAPCGTSGVCLVLFWCWN